MISKTYILATIFIVLVLQTVPACRSMQNYQNQNEPLFSGDYAESPPRFNGEIKVITWNIRFSEKVDQAIAEISKVQELPDADILLLQEMDEAGVEAIAKALAYNYIYFPASIHIHHDKNFGNAILSPWPISNPAKLILPYSNPKNNQIRIAVRGLVTVGDTEVLVYSIHTETAWLSQQKRQEQIQALLNDLSEDYEYVIVGGDFNTFTAASIVELENRFELVGLERASVGASPTFTRSNFSFTLDHIFAKGFSVIDNGVWKATEASDHYPVWGNLSFD
jgi:endonuclease/exonuclease/phosphatase family metal-dependent hydrolase